MRQLLYRQNSPEEGEEDANTSSVSKLLVISGFTFTNDEDWKDPEWLLPGVLLVRTLR